MVLTAKSFKHLSEVTGFPIDQLNFIAGMVSSLFLAVFYNLYLPPQKNSKTARLAVGFIGGIAIGWLCYASGILQLVLLPSFCYVIMVMVSPDVVHRYIFIFALTWLSVNHIYRQVTDYGGYKLDITGPLMLMTQRVTYVAYALHDGCGRDPAELTEEQKMHSLKERPGFLEYFSYILHFSTVLAGPSLSYFEYMEFIEGGDIMKWEVKMTVIRKCLLAFVFLGGIFLSIPLISAETCIDPNFTSNASLVTKIVFAYIVIAATKLKYYFAWTFADAVNNAAGMGFNGYDDNGSPLWDKCTGCNILNIEFATNIRMLLSNWNIPTVRWLKRTVYDRTERYRVLSTFVVSAFWHGFYPGYYLAFVSVGLTTLSARTTRRSFHAFFQESRTKRIFYDILTWFVTMLLMVYHSIVFVLLHFETGIIFWRSTYFYGHILILLGFTSPWVSSILGVKRTTVKKMQSGVTDEVDQERNNCRIEDRKEE